MYYDEEMTFEEEQAEHDFENQMHESTKQAEKQCDIHVVVSSENCNKCKKEISRKEFDYGMGECLTCFPEF